MSIKQYNAAGNKSTTLNFESTIDRVFTLPEVASAELVPKDSPTFTGTVSGINKTMVGLSNVTNESKATMFTDPTFTGLTTGGTTSLAMDTSSNNKGSFVCRASGTSDSNLAGMSFHNDAYAIKLGIRADGYFGLGGWSRVAWSWYSDPSGNMTAAGNVTAYSDPRLKDNISQIANPMEIINALNGVRFTWNDRSKLIQGKWGKADIGILANEVKAVLPEIVTASITDDENGEVYDTVDYGKLVAVLIEAIKAQQVQINKLVNDITILKG
jgi:hypothetical protein